MTEKSPLLHDPIPDYTVRPTISHQEDQISRSSTSPLICLFQHLCPEWKPYPFYLALKTLHVWKVEDLCSLGMLSAKRIYIR